MENKREMVRQKSLIMFSSPIEEKEAITAAQANEQKAIAENNFVNQLDVTSNSLASYIKDSIQKANTINIKKKGKTAKSVVKVKKSAFKKENVEFDNSTKKPEKPKETKAIIRAMKTDSNLPKISSPSKMVKFKQSINELLQKKSFDLEKSSGTVLSRSKTAFEQRSLVKRSPVFESQSEDEENSEEDKELSCVLDDSSFFLFLWENSVSLLVLYSITVIPYIQVFNWEEGFSLFLFHTLIDIIFLSDIVVSFFTPVTFSNSDGKNVRLTSNKEIAVNYLTGQFLFDFISAIPVNLILLNSDEDSSIAALLRVTKLYRLFKWFRVFRMTKFFNGKKNELMNSSIQTISSIENARVLKIVIVLFLFLHIGACVYIFLALEVELDDNWVIKGKMQQYSDKELYVASFYFCLTTVLGVGYGDITSKTLTERSFNICFMMIGVFLFSCLVSAISKIFYEIDEKTYRIEQYSSVLAGLNKQYNIPDKLYSKILNTLRFNVKRDYSEIYQLSEDLPAALRNKFIISVHKEQVKNLVFFREKPYEFISTAMMMLRSNLVSKGEILVNMGNYIDEMFLISKGSVYLNMGSYYDNLKLAIIRQNFSFGDILLHVNGQSPYEVKAKSETVSLMMLTNVQFIKLRNSFQEEITDVVLLNLEIFERIERRRKVLMELYKDVTSKEELRNALKVFDFWVLKRGFEADIKIPEIDQLILEEQNKLEELVEELRIDFPNEAKVFQGMFEQKKEPVQVMKKLSEKNKIKVLTSQILKFSRLTSYVSKRQQLNQNTVEQADSVARLKPVRRVSSAIRIKYLKSAKSEIKTQIQKIETNSILEPFKRTKPRKSTFDGHILSTRKENQGRRSVKQKMFKDKLSKFSSMIDQDYQEFGTKLNKEIDLEKSRASDLKMVGDRLKDIESLVRIASKRGLL